MQRAVQSMARHKRVQRLAEFIDQHPKGLKRAGRTFGTATALGLGALFVFPPAGLLILPVGLLGLFVVALLEGPYLLFRRVQIRLHEMTITVSLLSACWAYGYDWSVTARSETMRWTLVGFVLAGSVVWIVRGVAWGLWVAKMLELDGAWARLGLMFMGLGAPVALVIPIALAVERGRWTLSYGWGVAADLGVVAVWMLGWLGVPALLYRLHKQARMREAWLQADARERALETRIRAASTAEIEEFPTTS
ncbi:MAG: hypothetical protein HS116_03075 [Planctomycetes bacterium]|nr:hypothetical protein [Planctomycetota bacterium]